MTKESLLRPFSSFDLKTILTLETNDIPFLRVFPIQYHVSD